jgi:hypothetical protein
MKRAQRLTVSNRCICADSLRTRILRVYFGKCVQLRIDLLRALQTRLYYLNRRSFPRAN